MASAMPTAEELAKALVRRAHPERPDQVVAAWTAQWSEPFAEAVETGAISDDLAADLARRLKDATAELGRSPRKTTPNAVRKRRQNA